MCLLPALARRLRPESLSSTALALLLGTCLLVACGDPAATSSTAAGGAASDAAADTIFKITDLLSDSDPQDASEPADTGTSDGALIDGSSGDGSADETKNEITAGDSDAGDAAKDQMAACPAGPGCPCSGPQDCDLPLCLETPDGKFCAKPCVSTCADGFTCSQLGSGGGDPLTICVPKYGWRCDPCTASSQCAAPGQPGAQCVRYGDSGSFCGNACQADGDCGPGFLCNTAELAQGGTAKQCVADGGAGKQGVCPCSVRAVSLGLSTGCGNDYGNGLMCKGNRTCKQVGSAGATPCSAPAPVTETCNNSDDDCDGKTDEGTCDDGNPCTADSCDPKGGAAGGCSHAPAENLVCDDANPCTAGDVCKASQCASGPNICDCQATSDCAKQEDGDLCNGQLLCDTASFPHKCKLDPKTIVKCDSSADTACAKSICNPTAGTCAATPVADGSLCDDGQPCSTGDTCKAGQCASGANICDCKANGDCAKQEDGNLCNGQLFCDTAIFPHKCKLDPKTVVKCDSSSDTACTKAACNTTTGKCAETPVADGSLCEDGGSCTVTDICKAGLCKPGTDICGCKTTSDCASKEDGDLCNGTLYCDVASLPYSCKVDPKTPVSCTSAGDTTCTKNVCNGKTGKCAPQAVAENGTCSDGNACTGSDICKAGNCTGTPTTCNDSNVCTTDSCSTTAGCVHTANSDPCDDGNACTTTDTCVAKQCKAGPPPSCTDFKKNGGETGTDCGGAGSCGAAACGACTAGEGCKANSDCESLLCSLGSCTSANCTDMIKNGNEEGTDCGGSCGLCPALLVLAGGSPTVAGQLAADGAWKTATFAVPTVDDVAIAPAFFAKKALGALRFTQIGHLNDKVIHALQWTSLGWQAPISLGDTVTARSGPVAAQVGSQTLVAYHGEDYGFYTIGWNGSAWTTPATVGSPKSFGPSAPALMTLGSTALLAYIDGAAGNQLAGRVYAGGSWSAAAHGGSWPDLNLAPTLVATGAANEAMAVAVKPGGQVAAQLWSGGAWKSAVDVPSAFTNLRVALTLADGKVHLAFRGQNGKLYHGSWANGTWSTLAEVGSPAALTKTTPALAKGLNGKVELAWVDSASTAWHSSLQGSGWSAPVQLATGAKSVSLLRVP